jgi:hypothetical protein
MQLDDEALLLPREASDHLRMRIQALANWRCYGGGPEFTKVGNRIFCPMSKLRSFVQIYSSTAEYGRKPPRPPAPPAAAADDRGDRPRQKADLARR